MTLSIRILHRHGFDQPIDACEIDYLKHIREHLEEFGVCER